MDGDLYTVLLPLTESMEQGERWLAAVIIYRALLESILRRAQTRYYHHGVRYLRRLDDLASKVENWREFLPHDSYKQGLLKDHGRKRSFWSRYNA